MFNARSASVGASLSCAIQKACRSVFETPLSSSRLASRQSTPPWLENHHLQPGPHPLKTAARTTEEVLFLGLESNDPGSGQVRPSAPGFPALPHLGTVVLCCCHQEIDPT